MSYKEFEKDYKTQESRIQLSELYDLFIINPAIIYKVLSKLVPFLRNRNKSCAILPISYDLLQIKTTKYQLKLAKLIAKYRDSTYYMNFNLKHKFIKIGESKMDKDKLKENLINVLNYGLSILPNGGRKNVLRLSLHLNNTNIQLPFYVNIEPLDYNYDIIPSSITTKHSTHSNGIYLKKRKQIKLKAALKKNCNKKLKLALINNNNNNLSIANLTTLKYVKQCNV